MSNPDDYDDDDMAAVGRGLMAAIERETADRNGPLLGWHPVDCPSEVVGDLVGMLLQARTVTDDMVETACAAYVTEYCGGETEWPDGWNPVRSDDHRAAIRAALTATRHLAATPAPPAELREVVARAIAANDGCDPDEPALEPSWTCYEPNARAALSAISAAGYVIALRHTRRPPNG